MSTQCTGSAVKEFFTVRKVADLVGMALRTTECDEEPAELLEFSTAS
jgi:hypothetical protein